MEIIVPRGALFQNCKKRGKEKNRTGGGYKEKRKIVLIQR